MNDKLNLNSTQIPNIILDEWMSELTPAEFKVVMTIARQTYGWHKDTDQISYTQIINKTGYEREAVSTALRSLREKGFIQVTDGNGIILTSKEDCRGKSLHYRLVVEKKFVNRTSKIEHTKETIKNISLSKDKHNMAKAYGNENVSLILEEFKKISGLEQSADHYPNRAAWNFHQRYGCENFGPAMKYLQSLWKKDITKIETVKLHYPTYQKDVLKHSVIFHKLNEEEEAMELLRLNR